jgi:hypothetical protein
VAQATATRLPVRWNEFRASVIQVVGSCLGSRASIASVPPHVSSAIVS